jgi:hypothetical protein
VDEIIELAVNGINLVKKYEKEHDGEIFLEYSPESFTGTELEFSAKICNAVTFAWGISDKRKVILKLDKQEFINIWNDAIDSIEKAVEYFRHFYRIPVSQLLPYNALIVPFAYFFYHHKDKPTGDKQSSIDYFFYSG